MTTVKVVAMTYEQLVAYRIMYFILLQLNKAYTNMSSDNIQNIS